MRISSRTVVLGAAILIAAVHGGLAQTPPDPIVKVDGLRRISAHVHVIPDNSVPLVPNVGFVVGETGVLVIDTGLGPRNGAAVAEVAQRLGGSRALYLVTTHVHPEHDLGAQAFPAATQMLRARAQEQDIEEFGMQTAELFSVAFGDQCRAAQGRELPQGGRDVRARTRARSRRHPCQAHRDGRQSHARRYGRLDRGGSGAVFRRRGDARAARIREHVFAARPLARKPGSTGCAQTRDRRPKSRSDRRCGIHRGLPHLSDHNSRSRRGREARRPDRRQDGREPSPASLPASIRIAGGSAAPCGRPTTRCPEPTGICEERVEL